MRMLLVGGGADFSGTADFGRSVDLRRSADLRAQHQGQRNGGTPAKTVNDLFMVFSLSVLAQVYAAA